MITATRMHPMKIAGSLVKIAKDNFFLILILFIFNFGFDVATFIQVLRGLFLLFIAGNIVNAILAWWKTTYEIHDGTVHIRSGVFKRKHNAIPLSEVQNITRDTPVYFQPFDVTALQLETSATSDSASVKLEAIKTDQATAIEKLATTADAQSEGNDESVEDSQIDAGVTETDRVSDEKTSTSRTVHFEPTRKDLIKASFLSFSFLALIPILVVGYSNLEDVIDIDEQAQGAYNFVTSSGWILTGVIILIILILVGFGVVRTFLTYGKYEIASDDERIFIHQGVLSEKSFSIRKENVQAVKISQSPPKKLLGFAEVKLISAGSMQGESADISSLFPFLPVGRASSLVAELLPHLPMQGSLAKLPQNSLFVRMIRLPWFGLIAAGALLWFKINWWPLIIPLFILIYTLRYLNYRNTSYVWNDTGIHFRHGGLWTEHFITNRKKMIEINVEQGPLQRRFGLASITTVNRVKPVHHEELTDIPLDAAEHFKQWYVQRFNDPDFHLE